MVNLNGNTTNLPPGSKIKAALNAAADKLEASLWKFQMAQQVSQEQAENHFFDPKNGFSNDVFSVRKLQLEEKIRDSQITRQLISAIVETSSKAELAMFYHQILCSPPKTTLLKAIKNKQLETFPGLTYELINHHLIGSTATHKGHMVCQRQGH